MIIYETINLINGKKYIGMDSNDNPKYFGSGLLILRAIEKHGKDNFVKRIIEECKTKEELKEREDYWIQYYNARESENYYNIMPGGLGGDYFTHHPNKEALRERFVGKNNPFYGKTHTEENKEKMSFSGKDNYMFNKNHKEETKEKMRKKSVGRFTLDWFIERYGQNGGTQRYVDRNEKLSETHRGENNPFYGKSFEYEKHPQYTDIPKDELFKLLIAEVPTKDIATHFNTTTTTIRSKTIKYWDCNLTEFKSKQWSVNYIEQ